VAAAAAKTSSVSAAVAATSLDSWCRITISTLLLTGYTPLLLGENGRWLQHQ